MCECLKTKHIVAGYKCCACTMYNGLQRRACKGCGMLRCVPLEADTDTGAHFETYAEAYADDPKTLALIEEQIRIQGLS